MTTVDNSTLLQMDMFFWFVPLLFSFLSLYFSILLDNTRYAAATPPPSLILLLQSPQLSHREHKGLKEKWERQRQKEKTEESERDWTEGGFMAVLLCFLSVSWPSEWNSSALRPLIPNTLPKAISESQCVCMCKSVYAVVPFRGPTNVRFDYLITWN